MLDLQMRNLQQTQGNEASRQRTTVAGTVKQGLPAQPNVQQVAANQGDRRDLSPVRNPNRLGSVPVNLVLGQRGKTFDMLLTNRADYEKTRNKTSEAVADRHHHSSTLGRSFFMSNLQSVDGTVKSPIQHIIEDPTQRRTLPPIGPLAPNMSGLRM